MKKVSTVLMVFMALALAVLPAEARSLSKNVVKGNLSTRLNTTKNFRKAAPRQNVMLKAGEVDPDALSQLPLITEVPGGDAKMYARSSQFFGIDYYGQLFSDVDMGFAAEVVTEDDKVYFKNPYSGLSTDSYLAGTLADSKVTVTFPQKIYNETYYDYDEDFNEVLVSEDYYAVKMIYTNDGTNSRIVIDTQNPTITFSVTESGYEMEGDNVFIGLVYIDTESADEPIFQWTGFADTAAELVLSTATALSIPSDMQPETWILNSYEGSRMVAVAVNDTEVYVAGLYEELPNAAVKGEIKGNTVVFSSDSYLGISDRYTHFVYADFGTYEYDATTDEITGAEINNTLAFAYDAEKKTITGPEANILAYSTVPQELYVIDYITDVEIFYQDFSTPMTPGDPEMYVYEFFDEVDFGAIGFQLSLTATDGRLLNTDNAYYNIYIDDQVITLEPDEYEMLDAPMTDIPYDFTDYYDIYADPDGYHEMVIYPVGFDKIGVRALYVNENGEKTYSNISYYYGEGVEKTNSDSIVKSVKNYSIDGVEMNRPAKGTLVIRVEKMEDGSVKATKSIVR